RVRLSITLWGSYAEQVDAALEDRTKMSILIMQFAKHKIYRGKPSLSNLYNCTRSFINKDIL
nr:replication protein A 70 kDa DNA-binding subunit B-like [Tanacetum cinerariifolium]